VILSIDLKNRAVIADKPIKQYARAAVQRKARRPFGSRVSPWKNR
jgi:hypothetical protein